MFRKTNQWDTRAHASEGDIKPLLPSGNQAIIKEYVRIQDAALGKVFENSR
jgi:hypothetical protein